MKNRSAARTVRLNRYVPGAASRSSTPYPALRRVGLQQYLRVPHKMQPTLFIVKTCHCLKQPRSWGCSTLLQAGTLQERVLRHALLQT